MFYNTDVEVDPISIKIGNEISNEISYTNDFIDISELYPKDVSIDEPIDITFGNENLRLIKQEKNNSNNSFPYNTNEDLEFINDSPTLISNFCAVQIKREVDLLQEKYQFITVGSLLYFGDKEKGIWIPIPNEKHANKILGSRLSDSCVNIKNINEIYAIISRNSEMKEKTYFVNVKNIYIPFNDFVFDLEGNSIISHSLKNKLSYILPFSYKKIRSYADCKNTLDFLLTICDNNLSMLERLQQCLSIAMMNINLGKIFYLIGGEGNSRYILFQLLERAIGMSNVSNLSFLDMGKNFRISHIEGNHCNISFEEGEQIIFNVDLIKKLTLGGGINAERKNTDPFDFVSSSTLYCGGTILPNISHGYIETLKHHLEIIKLKPFYTLEFFEKRNLLSKKSIHFFRKWLFDGAVKLSNNNFMLQKADGCEIEDQYVEYNNFIDNFIIEAPNNKIHSCDITKSFCDKTGRNNIPMYEKKILHNRIRAKMNKEMKNKLRIDNKVSSGYIGIDLLHKEDSFNIKELNDIFD